MLAAELAIRLDFGLVGQIGDYFFVGLQSPQNVRPNEFAQWSERIVSFFRRAFNEACEFLPGPEQTGVDEIENRPQIAKTVFHRGAGERKPCGCVQALDGAGLFGAGILDSLRFVKHSQPPRSFLDPRKTK